MPGMNPQAQALTCRRGHYGWTDWQVMYSLDGWAVRAECELGDHWLTEEPGGRVVVALAPCVWQSVEAAEAVLRRYVEQHATE